MPNFQMKAKSEPVKQQTEVWNFNPQEKETKILAFSGKLGSGKTSSSNFLHSLAFMYVLGLTEHAFIDEYGKLVVKTSEGDYNEVNLQSKHPEVADFLAQRVWPFIKNYSFASPLKDFCVTILGLDENLVYGSQEDKATLTHLKWQDMPTKKNKKYTKPEDEYMTVREVLEYIGELMRSIEKDCWANALVRTIKREKPAFAIIDDLRYLNEAIAIKDVGGKVIRLTLVTDEASKNQHASNTELDNFDQFDAVIDNANMNMADTFRQLLSILTEWGYFAVVKQG